MSTRKPSLKSRRSAPDEAPAPRVAHHFGEINDAFLRVIWTAPDILVMSSEGGDMPSCFSAVDFLELHPTSILVTGVCLSAAVPVLASGVQRLATRRTRFMVHPITVDGLKRVERGRLQLEAEDLGRLTKEYCRILARRTKRPATWWESAMTTETWMDVAEAKKIGLVDRVA